MATFLTFKRLKDKGVAAMKAGDYAAARPYLIQAAECMIELAEGTCDPLQRFQPEPLVVAGRALGVIIESVPAGARPQEPTPTSAGAALEPERAGWP